MFAAVPRQAIKFSLISKAASLQKIMSILDLEEEGEKGKSELCLKQILDSHFYFCLSHIYCNTATFFRAILAPNHSLDIIKVWIVVADNSIVPNILAAI